MGQLAEVISRKGAALEARSDLRRRWRELLALGPCYSINEQGKGGPALAALTLARAERQAAEEGWWASARYDFEASLEERDPRFIVSLYSPDEGEGGRPLCSLGACDFGEASEQAAERTGYYRLVVAELASEYLAERQRVMAEALRQGAQALERAADDLEPSALEMEAHDLLLGYADALRFKAGRLTKGKP